jgi:hypothetical protein
MRHAAVIRSRAEAAPQLVGVGETRDDALAGARIWFQAQFDRTSHKDWPRLIALQDRLTVYAEHELTSETGIGLDEVLERMAAAGFAPSTAPAEPTASASDDAWPTSPPPVRRSDDSTRSVLYSVIFGILLIGFLVAVRYTGGRYFRQDLLELINADQPVMGPVSGPSIGTFDPDDFMIPTYSPWSVPSEGSIGIGQ